MKNSLKVLSFSQVFFLSFFNYTSYLPFLHSEPSHTPHLALFQIQAFLILLLHAYMYCLCIYPYILKHNLLGMNNLHTHKYVLRTKYLYQTANWYDHPWRRLFVPLSFP